MNGEMELKQTTVDILREIVELSDEFISDSGRHNLTGVKELVNSRKKILSGFETPGEKTIRSKSRMDAVKKIMIRCKEQDQTIEDIVRKIQSDLVDSVSQMKKVMKSMSGYKSNLMKIPRFIDKKR